MRAPKLVEQFEDLDKQTHAAHLAMWVFLASEVLLFTVLFALYAGYRAMYSAVFMEGIRHNSVLIGTTNTLILITSSATVALAVHAVRASKPKVAALFFLLSVLLGFAFLGLKGYEYALHIHEGIVPGVAYHYEEMKMPGAALFFTLYYLLTGLHALHVIAGICILSVLGILCQLERYNSTKRTPVELSGLYWHLVDIIWIFLWPMLYLMHG